MLITVSTSRESSLHFSQDRRHLVQFGFDLDDGRKNFLIEDLWPDETARRVGHQRSDGIVAFKFDAQLGEGSGDPLDVAKARADSRPAELD